MAKNSPLQNVNKLFGSKDQLVAKVAELISAGAGESPEDFKKRLKYVANSKLLRLIKLGEKVKELGGREALATKVAELKGHAKDKDFKSSLANYTLPRLFDLYSSLSRKAKASTQG